MVMEYLDRVFQDRMLALRPRRGDSWTPSSPDKKPCDFFLYGYCLPVGAGVKAPLLLFRTSGRRSGKVSNLSKAMVAKAVFGMRKKSLKLLKTGGGAFEGRKIRL